MANLIEAIQARCNELRTDYIPVYKSIGVAGALGVALMQISIQKAEAAIASAEAAIASGDTVAMIAALQDVRDYKL